MLSRVTIDHSQSSPLFLGHTLPVAGTHRQGRTETKQQRNKEMLSRVAIDHSQSSLLDTLCLLQGHTDRDVQKQRNKPTKKQRNADKG